MHYTKGIIPEATSVQVTRLENHLKRKKIDAQVRLERAAFGKLIRVTPRVQPPNLVSVIICFKDRPEWTLRSIQAFSDHAGDIPLELILVNNGSSAETPHFLRYHFCASNGCIGETDLTNYRLNKKSRLKSHLNA